MQRQSRLRRHPGLHNLQRYRRKNIDEKARQKPDEHTAAREEEHGSTRKPIRFGRHLCRLAPRPTQECDTEGFHETCSSQRRRESQHCTNHRH